MRLVSTRTPAGRAWTFQEALTAGLPPDGGLFVPAAIPPLASDVLNELSGGSFQETAVRIASHLLGEELGNSRIEKAVTEALDFPLRLVELAPNEHLLELFHGPTLAFKDVGARFMAQVLAATEGIDRARRTVLVATSGDTGAAVADAFAGLEGFQVVVLFPLGKVSPAQAALFTTLGDNVHAVGVAGRFDDCQALAKASFANLGLKRRLGLISANSINIGRLIPQIFYHVHAWAALDDVKARPVVSVPSGNFGNLTAGVMARELGVPIKALIAATNANRTVPDYLETGRYRARPSRITLSNAMDVGDPSNFERLTFLFGGRHEAVIQVISGSAWSDSATKACIADTHRRFGREVDPHTAVGLLGLRQAQAESQGEPGVVLATAHPAKFREVVEPLIGRAMELPDRIANALDRTPSVREIGNDPRELRELLLGLS